MRKRRDQIKSVFLGMCWFREKSVFSACFVSVSHKDEKEVAYLVN
jgi:hypothetical protein